MKRVETDTVGVGLAASVFVVNRGFTEFTSRASRCVGILRGSHFAAESMRLKYARLCVFADHAWN